MADRSCYAASYDWRAPCVRVRSVQRSVKPRVESFLVGIGYGRQPCVHSIRRFI